MKVKARNLEKIIKEEVAVTIEEKVLLEQEKDWYEDEAPGVTDIAQDALGPGAEWLYKKIEYWASPPPIADAIVEISDWYITELFFKFLHDLGVITSETFEEFLDNEFQHGQTGPIFTTLFRRFIKETYGKVGLKYLSGNRRFHRLGSPGTSLGGMIAGWGVFAKNLDLRAPDKRNARLFKVLKTIDVYGPDGVLERTYRVVEYAEGKPPVTLLEYNPKKFSGATPPPQIIGGYGYTGDGLIPLTTISDPGSDDFKAVGGKVQEVYNTAKEAAFNDPDAPRHIAQRIKEAQLKGMEAVGEWVQKNKGAIVDPLVNQKFPDNWAAMLAIELEQNKGAIDRTVSERDGGPKVLKRARKPQRARVAAGQITSATARHRDDVKMYEQINKILSTVEGALKDWGTTGVSVADLDYKHSLQQLSGENAQRAAWRALQSVAEGGDEALEAAELAKPIHVLPGQKAQYRDSAFKHGHKKYGNARVFEDAARALHGDGLDPTQGGSAAAEGFRHLSGTSAAAQKKSKDLAQKAEAARTAARSGVSGGRLERLLDRLGIRALPGGDEDIERKITGVLAPGVQGMMGVGRSTPNMEVRRASLLKSFDELLKNLKTLDLKIPSVPNSQNDKAFAKLLKTVFTNATPFRGSKIDTLVELKLMADAMKQRGKYFKVDHFEKDFMKIMKEVGAPADEIAKAKRLFDQLRETQELGKVIGIMKGLSRVVGGVGSIAATAIGSPLAAMAFYVIDTNDLIAGGVSPLYAPVVALIMQIDPTGLIGMSFDAESYQFESMGCWLRVSGPIVSMIGAARPSCYGLKIAPIYGIKEKDPECWEKMNFIYKQIQKAAKDGSYWDLKFPWTELTLGLSTGQDKMSYWADFKYIDNFKADPCASDRVGVINNWWPGGDRPLDKYFGVGGDIARDLERLNPVKIIENMKLINNVVDEIIQDKHVGYNKDEAEKFHTRRAQAEKLINENALWSSGGRLAPFGMVARPFSNLKRPQWKNIDMRRSSPDYNKYANIRRAAKPSAGDTGLSTEMFQELYKEEDRQRKFVEQQKKNHMRLCRQSKIVCEKQWNEIRIKEHGAGPYLTFELALYMYYWVNSRKNLLESAVQDIKFIETERQLNWGPLWTLFQVPSKSLVSDIEKRFKSTQAEIIKGIQIINTTAGKGGDKKMQIEALIEDKINNLLTEEAQFKQAGAQGRVFNMKLPNIILELLSRGSSSQATTWYEDPLFNAWARSASSTISDKFNKLLMLAWKDKNYPGRLRVGPPKLGLSATNEQMQVYYLWMMFAEGAIGEGRGSSGNSDPAKSFLCEDKTKKGQEPHLFNIFKWKLIDQVRKNWSNDVQEIDDMLKRIGCIHVLSEPTKK